MKVFLIRHGQSKANLHNIYAGQSDTPLTDVGKQQAAAVHPILAGYHFDKVYASDLQRAWHTCECALPGTAYTKLALLREYDVGTLTGAQIGSVKWDIPADPVVRPDYTAYGGENIKMVCARAEKFLQLLEHEDCEYVAVFSHYGFINSVLRTVLQTAYDGKYIATDNCAVHVVEYDGNRWKILALNYGIKV